MLLPIIEVVILSAVLFFIFIFLRQILFFGFAPFLPSNPQTVEKILQQLLIRDDYTVCSLSYGRSGFLRAVEIKYPAVKLIGYEDSWLHCLSAKAQVLLRRSRIKVVRSNYYKSDISRANIVYCYLDVERLREIYKKLKIESPAGAVIVSAGFIVPHLECVKILKTEPRKRWFSFLVGGQEKVLTEKEKEYKPDNNVYFYEV
jgi:hypothetical protein